MVSAICYWETDFELQRFALSETDTTSEHIQQPKITCEWGRWLKWIKLFLSELT